MNKLDQYIVDIGNLIPKADKPSNYDWDLLTIVYDIVDGHSANSGFLYIGDEVIPTGVRISDDKFAISNKIREFRDAMAEQTGKKFKQLLIQMERETGRIKIDFDFDKGNKWTIVPSRLKEMREELRPKFD